MEARRHHERGPAEGRRHGGAEGSGRRRWSLTGGDAMGARRRSALGKRVRGSSSGSRREMSGGDKGIEPGSARCVRVCAAAGGERRGERGSGQSVVRARVRKLVRAAGP